MMRIIAVFGLAMVLCFTVATNVEAGGWGRGRLFGGGSSYRPATPPNHYVPAPYDHYHNYYPTAEELYPKYYGSFHYRHLDNIGIPTGDIGIRGNGIYMSPW